MSASAWGDRTSRPEGLRESGRPAPSVWVNRDFSGRRKNQRSGGMIPLLLIALVVALGIAALRIDLIRVRYAMAAATETENTLIEERRALIARKRQLRDPTALAVEARARGFRTPDVAYSLPNPSAHPLADPAPDTALPSVAAGVPERPEATR